MAVLKVKRPDKVSLDKQTYEIMRLLSIWPNCSYRIVDEFIQQTLGVTTTRVCIQEARAELGLHEPEHTEQTLKKQKLVRYIVVALASTFGANGIPKSKFIKACYEALKEKFGEGTNRRLLQNWIESDLQELQSLDITSVQALAKSVREDLEKQGILEDESSQFKLFLV